MNGDSRIGLVVRLSIMKTKSWQVGWGDYFNGQHYNPYVDQTVEHRQWYLGWKSAKKTWRATNAPNG